jgi:hypothetical protein
MKMMKKDEGIISRFHTFRAFNPRNFSKKTLPHQRLRDTFAFFSPLIVALENHGGFKSQPSGALLYITTETILFFTLAQYPKMILHVFLSL